MKQAIKFALVVALAFLGIEKLFGCPHKRFSFPQTRRIGGRRAGVYVVCLKCGSEFPYDWNRMVRASATSKQVKQRVTNTKEKHIGEAQEDTV